MIPSFAVVGHPNKGKSSIVATLAENERIAVSPMPGTTRSADSYTLTVNGNPLYALVDTPGFQRAGAVLAWLRDHERDASERALVVAEFVEQHKSDPKFHDECELLRPILTGAGILYVVDGTKPYGAEYELEMQILQWTGRPRMALINMIGDGDYASQWRQALDQYFSIVRTFDALRADFDARVSLLRAFRELDENWRNPLDQAVEALQQERQRQLQRCAVEISDMLCDCVSMSCEAPVPHDWQQADPSLEAELQARLLSQIRTRERRARNTVQAIYRMEATERDEADLELVDQDLFTASTWALFGLSKAQLLAAGSVSGALAGGGLDALVGGTSLLAGTLLGGLIGGASAWFGSDELARVKVLGAELGGRVLRAGPIRSQNFPWVLLGRAWLHHRLVSERNHALRSAITVDVKNQQQVFDDVDADVRKQLNQAFGQVRDGDIPGETRQKIKRNVTRVLQPG